MNLEALCIQSHEIAKKSGFLDPPQTWEEVIDLIHSELSEALEEYRGHRKLDEVYYEFKVPAVTTKTMETAQAVETLTRDAYLALTPDARKGGKPCGIPSELADVVIRIAQYCGTKNWDLQGAYDAHVRGKKYETVNFLKMVAGVHCRISRAYEAGLSDERAPWEHLAGCIGMLEQFCRENNINLAGAVEEKAAFNATRPFRHGGKKI